MQSSLVQGLYDPDVEHLASGLNLLLVELMKAQTRGLLP